MKIKKCVNSATNSCGMAAKPSTAVKGSKGRFLYLTKHGLGPGTLPRGVQLIDSKELSPYITAIWLDRFLTTKELQEYDIYPETMITEILEKNNIDEAELESVTSATYDNSAEVVNADYVSKLMQSVDDNLPNTFVVYKYDEGSNSIHCTSASPSEIAEYDVPVKDLSGNMDEDMEYILGAINDASVDLEDNLLVEDGRYRFIDSKTVIDSDGFNTEYTMYYDESEDKYVFVFGDSDLYSPYDGYFDFECDTEQEAYEWFDSYVGPGEDDEFDEYAEFDAFDEYDW